MAVSIPTTLEEYNKFLSNIESAVNQTTPPLQKAYNKEIALSQAKLSIGHYRYAAARISAILWITAKGDDLDVLGQELNLPRKEAQATTLTARLPGVDTTVIPQTVNFLGDANGVRYFLDAGGTIGVPTSGYVDLSMTAELQDNESGTIGNLVPTQDTLTIGTNIAGADSQATVQSIDIEGTDRETDDNYRQRGLFVIRATFGGWSASDYKYVSELVSGVKTAFPYAGKPIDSGMTSYPGDRTIYIESTDSGVDGVPAQAILDAVRERLNFDPDTGLSINTLGIEDDTLSIEPISRVSLYVKIIGLSVDASLDATVKSKIDNSLDLFFEEAKMYVPGITGVQNRKDKITNVSVSDAVEDVLENYGASAETVLFGLTSDVASPIPFYTLMPGELSKRGGAVVYV